MFISLPQLEKNPVRFNVDVPAGEIEFVGNITQNSDLHCEGRAELLNHAVKDIRVHGDLKVDVSASCDRCLETVAITGPESFRSGVFSGRGVRGRRGRGSRVCH